MDDDKGLLTSGEAARALGLDRSTLTRWAQRGLLVPSGHTPGGHMRWDLAKLRNQIRQLQEEAPPVQDATTPERPPVAAAIVTCPLGVLVGRRHDGKPLWTFIAGEVEPGEAITDAAVREVKEETGLLVTAAAREIGRRVHPKTGRTMIYLACTPTEGTEVFVGDEEELAEVRWISLADADEMLPGLFDPVREHLRETLGG